MRNIRELAAQARIEVRREAAKNLSHFCRSEHHQGVVAEVEPFPLVDAVTLVSRCRAQGESVLLLVLDSIQDPQNFGALLRSAVCSGVQGVVFPQDRSAKLSATVAKASAGAIEHVHLCRVVNIANTLDGLKKEGVWIAGLFPGGSKTIYEIDYTLDLALVIGNEEKGIRSLVGKKCDFSLSIPLQGGFDSLNASVAGAVVMFEAMRQRRYQET